MSFEVYQTTAEHIIGATDAALQKNNGVDKNLVANFLDIPDESAQNALCMAEQLKLVFKNKTGKFMPLFPFAIYLVTSVRQNKAAILRLVLEQYTPYKTFKFRLELDGLAPAAASKVRALYKINAHRDVILGSFIDLGTYTNSLISEGAGLYRPKKGEPTEYLSVVEEVIQDRETAALHVRRRIGAEAADWVDENEVLDHLITAYQRAAQVHEDQRAPIVHAANAVESFLAQLADHYTVNVKNADGINAKAEKLAQENHLTTKHKFMLKYLGHVRNAVDHGKDPEIGQTWEISKTTAIEYVHVAQSVISALVAYSQKKFVV
ncbi:MAG: hypothetical protein A2Y65_09870 [Deltaproteobacteria bacterium RBG_13_52_11]|nr:MAG: hypothetical protein A2Y65_09870 [Deltaproteobacteria bacterium RBG_13_52_11]